MVITKLSEVVKNVSLRLAMPVRLVIVFLICTKKMVLLLQDLDKVTSKPNRKK